MAEKPAESEVVQCEICLKEIPASEAQSAEAEDYIAHFCGIECYDRWKKQGKPEANLKRR